MAWSWSLRAVSRRSQRRPLDHRKPDDMDPDELRSQEVASALVRIASEGAQQPTPCPDDQLLAGYADRALQSAEREVIEKHLAACATCRGLLAALIEAPDTLP